MPVASSSRNHSWNKQKRSSIIRITWTGPLPLPSPLINTYPPTILNQPQQRRFLLLLSRPASITQNAVTPAETPTYASLHGRHGFPETSARFSSFAVGKFATRALAQSLAREFDTINLHFENLFYLIVGSGARRSLRSSSEKSNCLRSQDNFLLRSFLSVKRINS